MAITTSTITGQLLAPAGGPLAGAVVKIRANTADGLLRDILTGQVVAYQSRVVANDDGNLTVALPSSGVEPASPQWIAEFEPKLGISPVYFTLTGDTTWADIVSVSETPAGTGLVAQLNTLIAQAASIVRPAKTLEVYCHSYGTDGASASQYLWQNLVARRIGATLTDRSISGSKFINGNPGSNCGYATMLQNVTTSAVRPFTTKVFSPNVGIGMFIEGLNTISDLVTNTGVDTALAVSAWKNAVRTMLSRYQVSSLYESTDATYITLGGAGWATAANTNQNSGTGYSTNSNSGRTVTVTTPSGWKGGVLVLGFVANRVGGTVPAGPWTFTVDAAAAQPIGYPTGFNTADAAPTNSTTAQYMVARFQLTPGAHTIVATTGTGGGAFDCIWVEADTPRACVWGGQPKTPSASATVLAGVDLINAATPLIIAQEFKTGVATWVDLDPLLAADADLFADGTHPNDAGHAIIADAMVQAWTEMTVVDHQLVYA